MAKQYLASKEWTCFVCGKTIEKEDKFYIIDGDFKCLKCKNRDVEPDKKQEKGIKRFFIM